METTLKSRQDVVFSDWQINWSSDSIYEFQVNIIRLVVISKF